MDYDKKQQFRRGLSPTDVAQRFWTMIKLSFGMDYRSLSLWRWLLGWVVIMDIFDRYPDIRPHYSDWGFINIPLVVNQFSWNPYAFSIHMASGTEFFSAVMFWLQGLISVLLMIGWRSRAMMFLGWYWNISLHIRTPLVLHNGDVYLRLMMFIASFLPIGEYWSIDRMFNGKSADEKVKEKNTRAPYSTYYISGFTFTVLTQLFGVYVVSVIHKYQIAPDHWYYKADSVWFSIASLDFYRTDIGELFLLMGHKGLRYMTWAVVAWEGLGWFGFVSPVFNKYTRTLGCVGYACLHLGFGLCMRLEQFVWIGMFAMQGLLPSWFWDTAVPSLYKLTDPRRERLIKIYTASTSSTLALFIESFFLIPNPQFEKFIRDPEDADRIGSTDDVRGARKMWLKVVDEEKHISSTNWAGIALLCKCSPVFYALHHLFSYQICQKFWDLVLWAYHMFEIPSFTYSDGKKDSSPSLAERESASAPGLLQRTSASRSILKRIKKREIVLNILGFFLFWFITTWYLSNVDVGRVPDSVHWIASPFHLYQTWSMFCPPPTWGWFHNIELRLKNGTSLELFKNQGLWQWGGGEWEPRARPQPIALNIKNHRWYKFWEAITWNSQKDEIRLEFGRWICREWNRRHSGDQYLTSHVLYFNHYPIIFGFDPPRHGAIIQEVLWHHNC